MSKEAYDIYKNYFKRDYPDLIDKVLEGIDISDDFIIVKLRSGRKYKYLPENSNLVPIYDYEQ